MAVIMIKMPDFDAAAIADTDFNLKVRQIIETAYRYIGETVVFDQYAKDLLQVVILNLQGRGYFFWNVEDVNREFTAPSQVTGNGDSKNYTCYRGHTASSVNRPPTGADWTKYWYEANSAGSAWALNSPYISTGDFYPASNTLSIDNAIIRYQNRDRQLRFISKVEYSRYEKKQQTGTPWAIFYDDTRPPQVFLYPQIHTDLVDDHLLIYRRVVRASDIEGSSAMDDFDSNWLHVLILLLAKELAAQRFNLPMERILYLENKADLALKNVIRPRGTKVIRRQGTFDNQESARRFPENRRTFR